MGLGFGSVAMMAVTGQRAVAPLPRSEIKMAAATEWGIKEISPDGKLVQRIEGTTRKTWKFNDMSKDRVQLAFNSEGRPINSEVQLWLGPDWTPFTLKAYSEDGKKRPIQTLVGTRNKSCMIEVRNVGDDTFPFSAASNNGELNSLVVCFNLPDQGNTIRVQNL